MNVDFSSSNFAGNDWNRMVLITKSDILGYPVDGAAKYANLVYVVGSDAAVGASAGISVTNTTTYATNLVIKNTAGTALSVSGYNSLASAQFIQIHDATTLPANGNAPIMVIPVAASSAFSFAIPSTGIPFSTGIVVCNSTTAPTLTIGAANCYFTATFK
jgi:hypothetical protein